MKAKAEYLACAASVVILWGCAAQSPDLDELRAEVIDVERQFAQTMANRDHDAFVSYLADEAIFVSGSTVLRGKDEVAGRWQAYFSGPDAPFSWAPETVAVLNSGKLALSSGPVRDPAGKQVFVYNSIWRQEAPGVWRIVFDKGERYCE